MPFQRGQSSAEPRPDATAAPSMIQAWLRSRGGHVVTLEALDEMVGFSHVFTCFHMFSYVLLSSHLVTISFYDVLGAIKF